MLGFGRSFFLSSQTLNDFFIESINFINFFNSQNFILSQMADSNAFFIQIFGTFGISDTFGFFDFFVISLSRKRRLNEALESSDRRRAKKSKIKDQRAEESKDKSIENATVDESAQ